MADAPNLEGLAAPLQQSFNPGATSRNTPQGAKDAMGTAVNQNGLQTPESTPGVDDARLEGDRKRRLAEEQSNKRHADEAAAHGDVVSNKIPEPSTTHQPARSTHGSLDAALEGAHTQGNSDSDADIEMEDEEASRAHALKEILACGNDQYLKILGLTSRNYSNKTEEQRVLERAYYDRGVLVYAAARNDGDAGDASKAWNSKFWLLLCIGITGHSPSP